MVQFTITATSNVQCQSNLDTFCHSMFFLHLCYLLHRRLTLKTSKLWKTHLLELCGKNSEYVFKCSCKKHQTLMKLALMRINLLKSSEIVNEQHPRLGHTQMLHSSRSWHSSTKTLQRWLWESGLGLWLNCGKETTTEGDQEEENCFGPRNGQ